MCDLEATVSNCRRHRCCVCGWLAFVSAMIVCYLKPKLRARVVLLLVTILVTAIRSGSYCDMAVFSKARHACTIFFPFWPMFRLSSNHQVFFVGIFHFSNIIIFFPHRHGMVICTCFTTRMATSSLLINGIFTIRHVARVRHFLWMRHSCSSACVN